MLCLASVLIFGLSSLWIGFHLGVLSSCRTRILLVFKWFNLSISAKWKRWASTHRRGCKENIKKNQKNPRWTLLLTLFQSTFQNFVGINPILFLLSIVRGEGKNMCVCTEHIILEQLPQGAELNVHFSVLSLIRSPFSTQENLNNEPVLSPG